MGLISLISLAGANTLASNIATIKSAIHPSKITLPKGPGTFEGLGESFVPHLNTGTSSFTYAFSVPAGQSGFAPGLALNYNSGFGNGLYGVGQKLLLPYVQRQTDKGLPNYTDWPNGDGIDNDKNGTIDEFEEFDTYINHLGHELVLVENNIYRSRLSEDFNRYERTDEGWIVHLANGTKLYLGSNVNSQVQKDSKVFRWHIAREESTTGQVIEYTYKSLDDSAQIYLDKITYNLDREIRFSYEKRDDSLVTYRPGFKVLTPYRGKKIDLYASDQLIKSYVFEYADMSVWDTQSMLRKIKIVDAHGKALLPPYEYRFISANPENKVSHTAENAQGIYLGNKNVQFFDMNSDGLADIVDTANTPGSYWINKGNNAEGIVEFENKKRMRKNTRLRVEIAHPGSRWGDFDGDGRVDYFKYLDGRSLIWQMKDNEWSDRKEIETPKINLNTSSTRLLDVNFDKRIDLVTSTGREHVVVLKNKEGWSEPFRIRVSREAGWYRFNSQAVMFADMNGDGLQDFLYLHNGKHRYMPSKGLGGYGEPVYLENLPYSFPRNGLYITDINADGLADIVIGKSPNAIVRINQGLKGDDPSKASFSDPIEFQSLYGRVHYKELRFADINANGSIDILYYRNNSRDRSIEYVELYPNEKPFQLKSITNGLGQTIELNYSTLVEEMKRDTAAGKLWDAGVPVGMQILKSYEFKDAVTGLTLTTEMDYHNGFYKGKDKAFRGFSATDEKQIGDDSQPTQFTAFQYHLGKDEEVLTGKTKSVEVKNLKGELFWKEASTWEARTLLEGHEDEKRKVKFAALLRTETTVLEKGRGTPVTLATDYDYDEYGNLTFQHEHGRLDGTWLDERITRTRYSSEFSSGRSHWFLHLPVEEAVSDELGNVKYKQQWFYDDESFSGSNLGQFTKGLLTASKVWAFPEENSSAIFSERHRYDAHGNLIATFGPLWGQAPGHATYITYDDTYKTFPIKEEIDTGKLRLTAHANYDFARGLISDFTDFNGHQTRYQYDELDRLTAVIKPGDTDAAPTLTYSYHLGEKQGDQLVNWIETKQRETKGGGTLDSRIYYDGGAQELFTQEEGDAQGEVIVKGYATYNKRGQAVREYKPFVVGQFGWVETASSPYIAKEYDSTGRILKTTLPDDHYSTVAYEPLIEIHQDQAQNDSGSAHYGAKKRLTQDGQDQLRLVDEIVKLDIDGNESGETEWHTRYDYDLLGNFVRFTDAKNNVRLMAYDALGRNYYVNDPDRGQLHSRFDDAGNVIALRDARGKVVYVDYDGVNRVKAKYWAEEKGDDFTVRDHRWQPGFNKGNALVTVEYDEGAGSRNLKGRIARINDQVGYEAFGYDSRGLSTLHERKIQAPGIDSPIYRTRSRYDSADRLVRYEFNDGTFVNYEYNQRGLLSKIPGVVDAIEYTTLGSFASRTLVNGIKTEYRYDNRDRMVGLKSTRQSDGVVLQDNGYHFDAMSNLTSIDDRRINSTLTSIAQELSLPENQIHRLKQNIQYQYDDAYRLIRAEGVKTYSFRYDAIGNPLLKRVESPIDGVKTQLMRFGNSTTDDNQGSRHRFGRDAEDPAGPHALTFFGHNIGYDKSGNRISDDDQLYTWDHENRLARIDQASGHTLYGYDSSNQRLYKSNHPKGSAVEHTLYINSLSEVRDGVFYKYVVVGEDKVARSDQAGGAFKADHYYLNQHLGSTAFTTDKEGKLLNAFTYTPFGDPEDEFGNAELTPYRFTGKERDEESGLGYFSQRYLNHNQGQFLTPDPVFTLPERFTDPQQWSPYSYARNNPVRFIDPTGMAGFEWSVETKIQALNALETTAHTVMGVSDGVSMGLSGQLTSMAYGDKYAHVEDSTAYNVGSAITDVSVKGAIKAVGKGFGKLMKSVTSLFNPCNCFAPGTLVLTIEGLKPIEAVRIGDFIAAKDENSGEIDWKPVTKLHIIKDRPYFELTLQAESKEAITLTVTDDHPFYVSNVGWIESSNLNIGDQVVNYDGTSHTVVGWRSLNKTGTTFNFDVKDYVSYFVSEQSVWVHNGCKKKLNKKTESETTEYYHYTDKAGFNAITSGKDIVIKASQPKGGNPFGAYFSKLAPDVLQNKAASRLNVHSSKTEYVIGVELPKNSLHEKNKGHRLIAYSKTDVKVNSGSWRVVKAPKNSNAAKIASGRETGSRKSDKKTDKKK